MGNFLTETTNIEDVYDNCNFDELGCVRCNGSGSIVICMDDICRGLDYCIHGDGEAICPDCKGKGWIGPEDTPTVG